MRRTFLQTTKIPLFVRVVSLYVVMTGPIVLMHSVAYANPPAEVYTTSFETPAIKSSTESLKPVIKKGTPKRLIIPRLSINLPVVAGKYYQATDSWTLSDDKAHFATITDKPNDQKGSTLIYGHATAAVFAPLSELKRGDIVKIRTASGHTFVYKKKSSSLVAPNETSVLSRKTNTPQLVLMTCEGLWSESRRMTFFDLKEVR